MKSGPRPTCRAEDSIADVARSLLTARAEAIAVVDVQHRALSVVTANTILEWVAAGGGNARQSIESLTAPPQAVAPHASVSDSVLRMGGLARRRAGADRRWQPRWTMQTVVPRAISACVRVRPLDLLRDLRRAGTDEEPAV